MIAPIKATKLDKTDPRIKTTTIPPSGLMKYSFKYLDLHNKKFSLQKCEKGYLKQFLTRVKELSDFTCKSFIENRSTTIRSNSINWENSSENGFKNVDPQNWKEQSYEFSITANKHGRVHGFIRDPVFYIVWIDPNHELFPKKN